MKQNNKETPSWNENKDSNSRHPLVARWREHQPMHDTCMIMMPLESWVIQKDELMS